MGIKKVEYTKIVFITKIVIIICLLVSLQQVKSAERYLKRLEFHLSKVRLPRALDKREYLVMIRDKFCQLCTKT